MKSIKVLLVSASSPRSDVFLAVVVVVSPDWLGSPQTPVEWKQIQIDKETKGKNRRVSNQMKKGAPNTIKSLQRRSSLEEVETCIVCFSFVKGSRKPH